MASLEQASKGGKQGEVRYLTPLDIETNKERSIAASKNLVSSISTTKDPDFLLKFVNEQGKILPRRLTGTSLKYQRKLSVAIKRSRHLALMPYVADLLK